MITDPCRLLVHRCPLVAPLELEVMQQAAREIREEWDSNNEDFEKAALCLFLSTHPYVRFDIRKLAKVSGTRRYKVREWAQRWRDNGVWYKGRVRVEDEDGTLAISFGLSVMCALGLVSCEWD